MNARIEEFDELKRLKLELDMETERLNKLINTVSLLNSNNDNKKVDGGCLNNTEDKYINLIDLLHKQEAVVKYITNKYYNLEDVIYSKIKKVGETNQIYSLILYERFVKLISPKEIAIKVHYSRRRFFQLQDEAIKKYNQIKDCTPLHSNMC